MNKEKVLPQQAAFYWARERDFEFWNMIVNVYGDAPFLRIDAWYWMAEQARVDIHVDEIEEFGPMIAERPPAIEGKRKDWA